MRLRIFRFVSAGLLLGWMILIFALSNETAAVSSQTSGGFSKLLFSFFYPPFNDMSDLSQQEIISEASFIIRKIAHFTIYGFLGVFALLSVISYRRLRYSVRCAAAFLICAAYAACDEWHQTFIAGRNGELRDVIIDSCGALLFIIIFNIILYSVKRRRKSSEIENRSGSEKID